MTKRWLAIAVAAAVAVGAGEWASRWLAPKTSGPLTANSAETVGRAPLPANAVGFAGGDQTRVPGAYHPPAEPAAPAMSEDRFKLVGVVAPRSSVPGSQWVALIAVNNEPARAFIVGAAVKDDMVLREVSAGGAIIGPRVGSVAMALELPPAPATGLASVPTPEAGRGPPEDQVIHGSKYLPIPQQITPAAQNPVPGPPEHDDGHWRPTTAP